MTTIDQLIYHVPTGAEAAVLSEARERVCQAIDNPSVDVAVELEEHWAANDWAGCPAGDAWVILTPKSAVDDGGVLYPYAVVRCHRVMDSGRDDYRSTYAQASVYRIGADGSDDADFESFATVAEAAFWATAQLTR